jgi:hypothetical protein
LEVSLHIFFFISKGLVQSHDSSREFSRLTQVNSIHIFFAYFFN